MKTTDYEETSNGLKINNYITLLLRSHDTLVLILFYFYKNQVLKHPFSGTFPLEMSFFNPYNEEVCKGGTALDRDIKLSNVKGLLIFLVVFGHLLEPYQEYYKVIYLFIYSFHMPLFVLISGYFAKHANLKKVWNFAMLYLIFQMIYKLFLMLIKPEHHFKLLYDTPYYHLWYLVSMALWYLLAIGINKLSLSNRKKVILILSCFIIGIVSRYMAGPIVSWMQNYYTSYDSYTLSYQRTLSFLPFFLTGFFLSKESMKRLYQSLKGNKLISTGIVCAIFIYFCLADSTDLTNILKGSYGTDQMEGELLTTTVKILLGYVFAVLMCYILLNAISKKECILTKWGNRSLTIYLFHWFIGRILKDVSTQGDTNKMALLPILFLMAILIVTILSSDKFVNTTYYLSHPYKAMHQLYKKIWQNLQPLNTSR